MTTEPVKMKEIKVSDDKISKSSKKDKKDKKDKKKKDKKEKKSKLAASVTADEPAIIEEAVAEPTTEAEPVAEPTLDESSNPSKKRKHSETKDTTTTTTDEAELQIDINAPEPPSKKQLRKLKKLKDQGIDVDALTAANVNLTNSSSTSGAGAGTKASNDKDDNSEKRSPYGVWIGNLAYDITTDDIKEFLIRGTILKTTGANDINISNNTSTTNDDEDKKEEEDGKEEEDEDGEQQSSTGILPKDITRIKLPKDPKTKKNKGFAYVDFTKAPCIQYAVLLSENWLGSRKVLIKANTDFKGRPDKPVSSTSTTTDGERKGAEDGGEKKITKTVFVGNLPFETTEDQIREHFAPAGNIKKIRMATFEDSGKCKGYAWVDYEKVEGAVEVISGWKKPKTSDNDDDDNEEEKKDKKRKKKGNFNPYMFLAGRKLRMEYGEDSTVRYNKRFGKKKDERKSTVVGESEDFVPFDVDADFVSFGSSNTNAKERRSDRRNGGSGKGGKGGDWKDKKKDARLTKPGAALAKAQRANVGIVESEGKKITFD